jgi:hypothetical protein
MKYDKSLDGGRIARAMDRAPEEVERLLQEFLFS